VLVLAQQPQLAAGVRPSWTYRKPGRTRHAAFVFTVRHDRLSVYGDAARNQIGQFYGNAFDKIATSFIALHSA
jgi:hypothetical protein